MELEFGRTETTWKYDKYNLPARRIFMEEFITIISEISSSLYFVNILKLNVFLIDVKLAALSAERRDP